MLAIHCYIIEHAVSLVGNCLSGRRGSARGTRKLNEFRLESGRPPHGLTRLAPRARDMTSRSLVWSLSWTHGIVSVIEVQLIFVYMFHCR